LEAPAPEPDLPEDADVATHPVRRELLIGLIGALAGFIVAPLAIYGVGHAFLGSYNRGGAGKLLADFMSGLAHGSPIFWSVALGPYVMTLLVRLLYAQVRGR
jgi:hypothetical protein